MTQTQTTSDITVGPPLTIIFIVYCSADHFHFHNCFFCPINSPDNGTNKYLSLYYQSSSGNNSSNSNNRCRSTSLFMASVCEGQSINNNNTYNLYQTCFLQVTFRSKRIFPRHKVCHNFTIKDLKNQAPIPVCR